MSTPTPFDGFDRPTLETLAAGLDLQCAAAARAQRDLEARLAAAQHEGQHAMSLRQQVRDALARRTREDVAAGRTGGDAVTEARVLEVSTAATPATATPEPVESGTRDTTARDVGGVVGPVAATPAATSAGGDPVRVALAPGPEDAEPVGARVTAQTPRPKRAPRPKRTRPSRAKRGVQAPSTPVWVMAARAALRTRPDLLTTQELFSAILRDGYTSDKSPRIAAANFGRVLRHDRDTLRRFVQRPGDTWDVTDVGLRALQVYEEKQDGRAPTEPPPAGVTPPTVRSASTAGAVDTSSTHTTTRFGSAAPSGVALTGTSAAV